MGFNERFAAFFFSLIWEERIETKNESHVFNKNHWHFYDVFTTEFELNLIISPTFELSLWWIHPSATGTMEQMSFTYELHRIEPYRRLQFHLYLLWYRHTQKNDTSSYKSLNITQVLWFSCWTTHSRPIPDAIHKLGLRPICWIYAINSIDFSFIPFIRTLFVILHEAIGGDSTAIE